MNKGDYGKLINPPINLQRKNFEEMVSLIGVFVKYQYPLENKQYNTQGELESNYSKPKRVGCIFNENIDQKTAKMLGWNAELQEQASLISLPYNLKHLQVGCLVKVPSAFDNAPGRLFRIVELSTIPIYPASITCKIVPEYETTQAKADTTLFVNSNFNILNEGN